MKTFEIKGIVREDLGKKATKALRVEGNVPCVLYGSRSENIHFFIPAGDLRKLIYTPNVYIVTLEVAGKTVSCKIKDLQFHPVSDDLLHIDFEEVYEDKPFIMEIPVNLNGFAVGVRAGGKLVLETRKLKTKGLLKDMPDTVEINIDALEVGQSIQVGALSFDNIEFVNAKNAVVAAVRLTRAARGAAAAAAKSEA